MYLFKSWDKDDRIKQMPQIQAASLKQGFSDAQQFGTPNTQHIDGF
jgi:hypothetical protein